MRPTTITRRFHAASAILLAAALILVVAAFTTPASMSEEEAAVRSVAQHYIDGAATLDVDHFNQAFDVSSADMKYVRTDRETGEQSVVVVPIEDAIKGWTSGEPQKSWGEVKNVSIIDDQLAHVTIEILWAGNVYLDVMSMYKVNGEWKIVNKTFVNRGPS